MFHTHNMNISGLFYESSWVYLFIKLETQYIIKFSLLNQSQFCIDLIIIIIKVEVIVLAAR